MTKLAVQNTIKYMLSYNSYREHLQSHSNYDVIYAIIFKQLALKLS